MKKLYEAQIADLTDEDIAKIAGGEAKTTVVEYTIVGSVLSSLTAAAAFA